MELEEEAFTYLKSIPEMEIEQMQIVKEDTGMDITRSSCYVNHDVITDTFVPTYPWGFFWSEMEIWHI